VKKARYAVGVDLGTTHTAMATVAPESEGRPTVFEIPQLTAPGQLERRALMPSCVYFAHQSEGALALPWDKSRDYAVGEYARARGVESPARLVSSAKSWLSHTGIDRRVGVLPVGAPEDIERISPVEATWRYLDHLAEAWQNQQAASELQLADQEVILAVPASFDAAARDLTVEAAYAAGMEHVTLLEEPQAALYAWIESAGESWKSHVSVGDVILVVDIGGGTTDFSAIATLERDASLELCRIAVGDHILLGGDNMDLALAHLVRSKLEQQGGRLDRWQLGSLTHACRAGKETLLSQPDTQQVPIVVASRGSRLVDSSLRSELTRREVEQTLLGGFFPEVESSARPATRARTALTQLGLPYAADPGITRHLADFLTRQAGAMHSLPGVAENASSRSLLCPTAVLFNGGVLKSEQLRARLLATLNRWLEQEGAAPARELPGVDLDLAVARGAAYYALVRRGRGLRIRGGTARAYYVGIESPVPAVPGIEPPITALCVAPFGMEEGTDAELPPQELGIVVGESVRFRFFGSTVRRSDPAGRELETWDPAELEELAPIEVTLPGEGRSEGDVVPIRLSARVTPVGTLLIEAVPLQPVKKDERWKIELSVREQK
jgi:hypothetical protein